MRLCEIDDQDRTWAKTTGIDLDIDEQYKRAVDVLDMLKQIKSPQLNRNWLPTIENIETNLSKIINANFANDQSSLDIKNKARKMLIEIRNLKNQL